MIIEETIQRAPPPIRLRDDQARRAIEDSLDANMMVVAGAGAGKTHALIRRMLALVKEGRIEVDEMAAITFTRKAAGEMRGRFFLGLRKALDTASPGEALHVQRALEKVDQCFIGTIHSFCGKLLRERPIEAGLTPDFIEVEDRDEAILRRAVWDAFIQSLYAEGDDRLFQLESFGIYPEDLYRFFCERSRFSELPLKDSTRSDPELRTAFERAVTFLEESEARVPGQVDKPDGLMRLLRRARHFLRNHGVETDRDRAVFLELFEGRVDIKNTFWKHEKPYATELRDGGLEAFQSNVVAPALRRWRECAYVLSAGIIDDAVVHYDEHRRHEGLVSFQDMLRRAGDLLRWNAHVRAYFQKRYRVVLVDEFQDTDPIQAEFLMYLAATDPVETNWKEIEPRPGSLFLVGDDKQSIYRFRRADVETFHFMRRRIEVTGGEVVELTTSFRSLGNLCRWLSTSFAEPFRESEPGYQAAFAPLYELRREGLDPHCVRKITVPYVKGHSVRAAARLEAERIAEFISAAVQGKTTLNANGDGAVLDSLAGPGDFMILTRSSNRLPLYARALERRGIACDVVGSKQLGESQEIRALVDLIRSVYEPDNPLPYLAYLRGPLVGLGDDELYDFRLAGGSFSFRHPIPDDLPDDFRERLTAAREQVRHAEAELTRKSPPAALEAILDRVGLLSFAAVHPEGAGSSRAGNLLRVLSLVRRRASEGWNWGQILEDLQDIIDDGNYNPEEMTLEAGRDDVVRILNVHQAKGLQAKVVFLADCLDTYPLERDPEWHVSRQGPRPYLAMVVTRPFGDHHTAVVAQPERWEDDRAEERRFQDAENVRLLYVAATRAQNLLVVSRYDAKPGAGPWGRLADALEDIPELEVESLSGDGAPGPVRRYVLSADGTPPTAGAGAGYQTDLFAPQQECPFDVWESVRRSLPGRIARIGEASYKIETVTGERADEEIEYSRSKGRGRDYGDLIHRLFEQAVKGILPNDRSAYIQRLALNMGIQPGLADDAIAVVEAFLASPIFIEASRSDQCFTEVPFAKGATDDQEVLRGVIDLVYRTEKGWKIIDYKTDAALTRAGLERLYTRYERQLNAYRDFWESATGEPVEAEIYPVHGPAD